MDLSFAFHDQARPIRALPAGLAVLLAGIAARQAASPTARLQAMLDRAPGEGRHPRFEAPAAFNRATAATLARQRLAMNVVFT
ncbi:hypothetical protein [Sphingomonas japonica]|uniref:Uncharacterized protein n=1 Tax=Sphingomonas japonica TaxID=511662 RepID=A0ABX0U253_9SPHN|nr:hypothetical protein [Sphingomonas japonica]NIJ23441.1 hypothetical protein [Sphingomonas japonica]